MLSIVTPGFIEIMETWQIDGFIYIFFLPLNGLFIKSQFKQSLFQRFNTFAAVNIIIYNTKILYRIGFIYIGTLKTAIKSNLIDLTKSIILL